MPKHRADPRAELRRSASDASAGMGLPSDQVAPSRPDSGGGARSGGRSNPALRRVRLGTFAGLALLVTAAAQAVTVDPGRSPQLLTQTMSSAAAVSSATALSSTVAVSSPAAVSVVANRVATSAALDRREVAVSRDATRVARVRVAEQRLRAATARAAEKRRTALAALAARAERQAELIAQRQRAKELALRNAWHLPVASGAYRLTSQFGECSSLWSRCHTGLDFAAPSGTPVRAVAAGRVLEVSYAGAYGNRTRMRLADGTEVWYCHQDSTSVAPGEQVAGGQVIGTVGSTGNSTGPHLHLEVRPDPKTPVDPHTALVAHDLAP